ncbi:MAG: MFS transporter [Dehalococcoidia bacterium]
MLSRPFVVLYMAVFVATMGISMVSPLLPVYAEQLGATGVWIGLTFSVFAITQTIVGPFAGRISDRFGRKPFITAGLLLYLVAALGYLTAESFHQVIAFRALSGVGTSLIFSVARAYIGEMVPPGHEGRWFGVFATGDIIGFGVGPLLAGVLRSAFGFDSVFVGMALLMGASAAIVVLLLPSRTPRFGRVEGEAEPPAVSLGFGAALRDRLVLALSLNMALTSLAFGATFSFLAVLMEDELGAGPVLIGVVFGAQSLASGLAQPLIGPLADRFDRRMLVSAGIALDAVFLFGLGLAGNVGFVLLMLVGQGAFGALAYVSSSAMQVVAGRRAGMGTVLGLGSAGNGVGIVVGSVIGGLLVDLFELRAAFFFGGLAMASGIPVFLALTRGVRVSEGDPPSSGRMTDAASPAPAPVPPAG